MLLSEKIDHDLKKALKEGDTLRVSTLRFLKASLINFAIEKKAKQLEDPDVLEVIAKLIKQHQESIQGFMKGNRQDLVEKETKELEILKSYCPPPLSREELLVWVKEAIQQSGAQDIRDLGKVMKLLIPKTKGQADGRLINELVKESLEGKMT